jgi:hypothetical protein
VVYAFSSGPFDWPSIHARYLIGLLIATPALLSPLWEYYRVGPFPTRAARYLRVAPLLLAGVLLLAGTIGILPDLPAARAAYDHENALIRDLQRAHITHMYSDYWTCDRIAFQSGERIICGSLDGGLNPFFNRARQYYVTVSADPRAAYVFPDNSQQVALVARRFIHGRSRYRLLSLDGYVIYQPL